MICTGAERKERIYFMEYDDKGVKKCVADRTRRVAGWMAGIMLAAILAGCGQMERPAGIAEDGRDAAEVAEKGAGGTEEIGACLLYTSDAADDLIGVDLGGRRIIKKIFFKQKTAYEMLRSLVGSEMCIRDRTYTNGCDWRWVGGMEPTEENADKAEYLLYSSWNVWDRKSGIEAVNKLLGGGHRAKCQECMDDLEAWGLLELSEMRFAEELTKIVAGERTDIDLGDVPGRYAVAYYMYHRGIGAEYIAAWDFCRVNQLYADFYLCGFMDYEEAMDASLENSLRLQKMYDSWDEMMDAYMMGYQFWQGDPEITEDSPTKERRSYYEMPKNSNDSPYELDWNMELKKSW